MLYISASQLFGAEKKNPPKRRGKGGNVEKRIMMHAEQDLNSEREATSGATKENEGERAAARR